KQIYFLGLYQQYHQISSLVDLEQKPAACPAFHNELVTFKDVLVLKNKHLRLHGNYKPVLSDPRLLPSYPVMSLPFDGGDVYTYLVMNPGTPVQAVIKEALYEYAQSLGQ